MTWVDGVSLTTVVRCLDLDAMVAFFVDECGARVESISPADAPRDVTLTLGGSSICVRRADRDEPAHLVVRSPAVTESRTHMAPNGTVVEFRSDSVEVAVPALLPSLSIVRAAEDFGIGRAGMGYRDLLPDRWGGAFIASHILIADGGDVPDYVHFHRIRFQMIFCARGWVDVVYEDQGEPFRLQAGDCGLQPPEIRHRVLRSSPGLEVIEIGCPAVHDTLVEHEITLPTDRFDPQRDFGGQRFVRHVAGEASRIPYLQGGLVARDTGIRDATDGVAGAIVVEALGPPANPRWLVAGGEFVLVVVLDGSAVVAIEGAESVTSRVGARDAIAFPPASTWSWSDWTSDFEFLEVSLPAEGVRRGGRRADATVWAG
ncbi:MAG: cupin [Acidimicrobiales bacterium]|nr:MAG: cupin [Acidimicrobiales bacterium]